MMNDLIELLHDGRHSLVIANGDIRTFHGRGVSDLYALLKNDPAYLNGASIADKVVGKGAAALMMVGGVEELYAEVISSQALGLLHKSRINVTFGLEVPHISNNAHNGWCPVELLCKNIETAQDCIPLIGDFMVMKNKKMNQK